MRLAGKAVKTFKEALCLCPYRLHYSSTSSLTATTAKLRQCIDERSVKTLPTANKKAVNIAQPCKVVWESK